MSGAASAVSKIIPLKAKQIVLPDDDDDLVLIPPGDYRCRFAGHRIVRAFDSWKAQAFFELSMPDASEVLVPGWFRIKKCGEKAYRPLSARSRLGRCLDSSTGSWRSTWGELKRTEKLFCRVASVTSGADGEALPPRQQYSKVHRFWSATWLEA